jgi:hypothetical protein
MWSLSILSSKGKNKLTLPNCWAELSTGKYQQIVKDWDRKDVVQLFSILSGTEYKVLHDTKDPELESRLYESTRFLYEESPTFKEEPLKPYFFFQDKTIRIQKDVTALSIGQSVLVRQRMDEAKTFDELISITLAVYLQPLIDESDFDPFRAFDLEEKILAMPITETYPLGFFLLRPLMKHGKNTGRKWSRTLIQLWRDFTKREKHTQKQRKSGSLTEINILT